MNFTLEIHYSYAKTVHGIDFHHALLHHSQIWGLQKAPVPSNGKGNTTYKVHHIHLDSQWLSSTAITISMSPSSHCFSGAILLGNSEHINGGCSILHKKYPLNIYQALLCLHCVQCPMSNFLLFLKALVEHSYMHINIYLSINLHSSRGCNMVHFTW